ncbi:hypothetical protein EIP86_005803 [Pleurotus ostreatoroseus]|nr:hypothetical protein EIP86_005803 [Pleurotus ostreatoroseus]
MDIIFPSMFYDKSKLTHQKLQLHKDSTFEEVIWIFSRLKDGRISLQQNMQFYSEGINKKFQLLDPVNNPSSASKQTYYVLVDRPVRILFDLRKPRIFGNMWNLDDSRIVLKEFNGKLVESEIIRRDIPVNTFHVNGKTSRRLNWKYALDLAFKDLAKIEERHQGEDFPIYKIQSAEPEVRTKSSSITIANAPPSSHPLLRLSVRRITNAKMIQKLQPSIAAHPPTTVQAHAALTQNNLEFPAPSQVTLTNVYTTMPNPIAFPQPQPHPHPHGTHSLRGPAILPAKPTQQLNSVSTTHVTAATQAWGAPSPQPLPQSSAPPQKRGWVRRMIDRFTGKSVLFAGIQSQFLGAFLPQAQSLVQAGRNTLAQALIAFFYITFFFHISVTISSLVLIDEFGGMQVRAARSPQDGPEETDEEPLRLLKKSHND